MARETLPVALELMFGSEGGYSNRKTDRGGPTKYGVTAVTLAAHRGVSSVAAADVEAMTIGEAQDIYRQSYWSQSGGDVLPAGLDYAAFDFGVNSGPVTAVKKLQDVLGVTRDGHIGEQTLAAVRAYPGGITALINAYCDRRMKYLQSLGGSTGFSINGRGWTIRVTGKDPKGQYAPQPGVVGNALKLAANVQPQPMQAFANIPTGKASPQGISVVKIIQKPEAWGPLAGLLSAGGAFTSGSGPVQWAFAFAMVAAVAIGVIYFAKRIRAAG